MKLTFRQGIARHQTDANGNSVFLQRSSANPLFIDLVVSPDPTVVVFAHKDSSYIIEELKTVQNAWGPLSSASTMYLYWDVNLLTGAVTRGVTTLQPVYTSIAPSSPQADQHWFDTVSTTMFVFSGTKWVEKIRCFAGYVTSGAIIKAYSTGSQAGVVGDFEGGNLVLDSYGMPLRQSNGCFVTTSSALNVVNLGTLTAKLDSTVVNGLAEEEIPQFSVVQFKTGKRMVLARSTDYRTRVAGIAVEDLYEGEIGRVVSNGVVQNSNWSFSTGSINRPVFCGSTGQVTLTPPQTGVLQQIGFVYDTDMIFVSIKQPIILDDPGSVITPPVVVVPGLPSADFSVDVAAGIAPLTVNFTNLSNNATNYEWDFTNDGYVDSTTVNPSYTYAAPGLYTVRLRAVNGSGVDDKIVANVISVQAPNYGPSLPNLGVKLVAAPYVVAGSEFSIQVVVSNDGNAVASDVVRTLTLRTDNGADIVITNAGLTVTKESVFTNITLPTVSILAGNTVSYTITAMVDSSVNTVLINSKVTCAGADALADDNVAALSIGVRV